MSDEAAVQPSPELIAKLHRKLRDPSIVPRFEARRQGSGANLIRPHWKLCSADGNHHNSSADGLSTVPKPAHEIDRTSIASNSLLTKSAVINAIPRRNYIDLRLEQNKLFADERYQQYIKSSADWKDTVSTIHGIKANEKRNKQWDTMQSCITEGLAAYPDHKGLLGAQEEIKQLSRDRREVVQPVAQQQKGAQSLECAQQDSKYNAISAAKVATLELKQPRKGAEGRAHAAMRDALLERNFLANGAATRNDSGEYSLLPEEDEAMLNPNSLDDSLIGQKKKSRKHDEANESSEGSSSSEGSYRRQRKEKKRKKDKHRKKRKHKHEKKRHRKSRKRSRSSSVHTR